MNVAAWAMLIFNRFGMQFQGKYASNMKLLEII